MPTHFEQLPLELQCMITYWLYIGDLSRLARTNRYWHSLFQPSIVQIKLGYLMLAIAQGNEMGAKRLLESNPYLLLEKHTSIDLSPWQLALNIRDISMLQMMMGIHALVNDNEKIALAQFNEQYVDAINQPENRYNFSTIVNAISNEQFNNRKISPQTEDVLNKFRDDFTCTESTKKYRLFTIKTLLSAIEEYNVNLYAWNHQQSSLFFREVVGYLQRIAPVCFMQYIFSGISKSISNINNNIPTQREINSNDYRTFLAFHENSNTRYGLGFTFGISIKENHGIMVCGVAAENVTAVQLLIELDNAITRQLTDIKNQLMERAYHHTHYLPPCI